MGQTPLRQEAFHPRHVASCCGVRKKLSCLSPQAIQTWSCVRVQDGCFWVYGGFREEAVTSNNPEGRWGDGRGYLKMQLAGS